jgi:hypothetical protein
MRSGGCGSCTVWRVGEAVGTVMDVGRKGADGSEGRTSATYTIPVAVRLTGALDVRALEAALWDVVERHESLRTIFPERDGVARQEILDAGAVRARLLVTPVSEAGLAGALAMAGGVAAGAAVACACLRLGRKAWARRLGAGARAAAGVAPHCRRRWSLTAAGDLGRLWCAGARVAPGCAVAGAICRHTLWQHEWGTG